MLVTMLKTSFSASNVNTQGNKRGISGSINPLKIEI